eukprot:3426070-Rhodomonas_salina.1
MHLPAISVHSVPPTRSFLIDFARMTEIKCNDPQSQYICASNAGVLIDFAYPTEIKASYFNTVPPYNDTVPPVERHGYKSTVLQTQSFTVLQVQRESTRYSHGTLICMGRFRSRTHASAACHPTLLVPYSMQAHVIRTKVNAIRTKRRISY